MSSYRIVDIELADLDWESDLPIATIGAQECGVAAILRFHEEPVGFHMLRLPPGSNLSLRDLQGEIEEEILERILARKIRDELAPCCNNTKAPTLTATICTKDRPQRLARCLDSLLESWRHCGSPTEVELLVVDNAPSDQRTESLVNDYGNIHYAREPVPGLNLARNTAMKTSQQEVVAFIDDDVVVDKHWFDSYLRAWQRYPQAGAISGQVLPYRLDTRARILFERAGGFRRTFETQVFSSDRDDPNRLYPCNTGDFGVGCNMSFRRELVLELGGFDPALDTGPPLPGGGDHDMLYRVVRSCQPLVYAPSCVVFHEHRETMAQLRKQYWSWGESTIAFAKKSQKTDPDMLPRWRRLIFFWMLYQVKRCLRALMGREVLPLNACVSELVGCVVGYVGSYKRSCRRMVNRVREHAS